MFKKFNSHSAFQHPTLFVTVLILSHCSLPLYIMVPSFEPQTPISVTFYIHIYVSPESFFFEDFHSLFSYFHFYLLISPVSSQSISVQEPLWYGRNTISF